VASELAILDVAYRVTSAAGRLGDGLADVLRYGRVLTVSSDRPAAEVARQAEEIEAEVVAVVDATHALVAYVIPDWVRSQTAQYLRVERVSFADSIGLLEREPRDRARGHFHEWLNFDRPQEKICPGRPPEGAHATLGAVPCRRHR
jgi:hypothetical protein